MAFRADIALCVVIDRLEDVGVILKVQMSLLDVRVCLRIELARKCVHRRIAGRAEEHRGTFFEDSFDNMRLFVRGMFLKVVDQVFDVVGARVMVR